MSLWFVKQSAIVATPSDSNDGKDPFGFNLSAATWTASSKVLVKAGAFSSYSWVSGDPIWISSATAGTDGWYEIASKDSDDQLTLGDLIEGTGIATDQTDVTSSDGPFAGAVKGYTIFSAAGDQLRICDDGVHPITAALSLTSTSGTLSNPLRIEGASARGVIDGSAPTIRADNSAIGTMVDGGSNVENIVHRNLDLDGNSNATNIAFGNSGNSKNWRWYNVRMHHADGGFGYKLRSGGDVLIDCEIDNCANGLESSTGKGPILIIRSSIHDCTAWGINWSKSTLDIRNSLIYRNTSGGIKSSIGGGAIEGNTIFGNGGDGLDLTVNGSISLKNNTLSSNGGYGLNTSISSDDLLEADYNHYYNNTSGETNLSETPGDNNQSGDPLFTSVVDGSEDFTPKDGSPLIDNGLDAGSA